MSHSVNEKPIPIELKSFPFQADFGLQITGKRLAC